MLQLQTGNGMKLYLFEKSGAGPTDCKEDYLITSLSVTDEGIVTFTYERVTPNKLNAFLPHGDVDTEDVSILRVF